MICNLIIIYLVCYHISIVMAVWQTIVSHSGKQEVKLIFRGLLIWSANVSWIKIILTKNQGMIFYYK